MPENLQRVQKIIADSGLASRRKAERLIDQKRVTVNGKLVSLGAKATVGDEIRIDNKIVKNNLNNDQPEVILLNKPEGYITTRNDPQNRKTVFQLLPKPKHGRWISIGRLDINTSGLLLFTTNGQLANQLMHPASEIEREYLCRVYGDINPNKINKLKSGFVLKNEKFISKFEDLIITASQGRNHWVKVALKQGKYREVRHLWQQVECRVNRLIRVRFGSIKLPETLSKGQYQVLTVQQTQNLINDLITQA